MLIAEALSYFRNSLTLFRHNISLNFTGGECNSVTNVMIASCSETIFPAILSNYESF